MNLPNLGLATNKELSAEIAARQSIGHTDPDYRSSDKTAATKLDEVVAVAVAPGNAHANHYLRGMANGLILAQHTVHNDKEEIEYIGPEVVKEFDYMAEADKTCSIVWNPGYVNGNDMVALLKVVVDAAEAMNLRKKLFFRGKSPSDVGLELPAHEDSLDMLAYADDSDINIIHGIVGVITEAGEMAELLLKHLQDREPFDRVHVLEEAGDVYWYLARQLRGIGADVVLMGEANIDKLHGRHGDAFNVFRDANRDLKIERAKLETVAAPLFERAPAYDGIGELTMEERAESFADAAMKATGGRGVMSDAEIAVERNKSVELSNECEGTEPHNPPAPGLVWERGCWRREIVRDVPGLA